MKSRKIYDRTSSGMANERTSFTGGDAVSPKGSMTTLKVANIDIARRMSAAQMARVIVVDLDSPLVCG